MSPVVVNLTGIGSEGQTLRHEIRCGPATIRTITPSEGRRTVDSVPGGLTPRRAVPLTIARCTGRAERSARRGPELG